MTDLDVSKLESEQAKAEFKARYDMQEQHLEEKYGKVREAERHHLDNDFVNHALLNWILTIHSFTHLEGMDKLNAIQKVMMMHLTILEKKASKLYHELGEARATELVGPRDELLPSEMAAKGLKDVQEQARLRARMKKYLVEPKIITEL